ncbi:hypothetical protein AWM75_06135 [Aerococcus urinaehominis]|uniref:Foldase protein PrsA n=1 Tax=Aerococcus urinaehominis TaxID=128944 RepID=A0A0X8FLL8_9LACT|nr:peptidylprolyl isomerase [Aerococcus urinaehominis]AMB99583.1 hypothetical protein AWM75_06135 [Aerococcus urinaehominis]SDL86397.1 foldase protein PrsA [Aerococcus urinaehominis]
MITKNKAKYMLLATLSLISLAGCQKTVDETDQVATGKNISITNADILTEVKETTGENILQKLILTDIFEQELGQEHVKEIDKQVKDQVQAMEKQAGSEENLNKVVQQSGLANKEAYAESLRYYRLLSETAEKQINISDEELKAAYENYQPAIEVSHILVADENQAKDLIKQLESGSDFAELAKEHSTDPGSKEKGGALGAVKKGSMVKEFEDAAFALKEGEYTKQPVKSQYGYHIIKVDKKPEKASFEEEKDQLTSKLKKEKLNDANTVKQIILDLLDKYQVEITDKALQDTFDQFEIDNTETDQDTAKQDKQSESSSQAEANE